MGDPAMPQINGATARSSMGLAPSSVSEMSDKTSITSIENGVEHIRIDSGGFGSDKVNGSLETRSTGLRRADEYDVDFS